jgi:hypothetical protein
MSTSGDLKVEIREVYKDTYDRCKMFVITSSELRSVTENIQEIFRLID